MSNNKMRKILGPRLMVALLVSLCLLYSLHQQWLVAISDVGSRDSRDVEAGPDRVRDVGVEGQGEDRSNLETVENGLLEHSVDVTLEGEEEEEEQERSSLIDGDDLAFGGGHSQSDEDIDGQNKRIDTGDDGGLFGRLWRAWGENQSEKEPDLPAETENEDWVDLNILGQGQRNEVFGENDGIQNEKEHGLRAETENNGWGGLGLLGKGQHSSIDEENNERVGVDEEGEGQKEEEKIGENVVGDATQEDDDLGENVQREQSVDYIQTDNDSNMDENDEGNDIGQDNNLDEEDEDDDDNDDREDDNSISNVIIGLSNDNVDDESVNKEMNSSVGDNDNTGGNDNTLGDNNDGDYTDDGDDKDVVDKMDGFREEELIGMGIGGEKEESHNVEVSVNRAEYTMRNREKENNAAPQGGGIELKDVINNHEVDGVSKVGGVSLQERKVTEIEDIDNDKLSADDFQREGDTSPSSSSTNSEAMKEDLIPADHGNGGLVSDKTIHQHTQALSNALVETIDSADPMSEGNPQEPIPALIKGEGFQNESPIHYKSLATNHEQRSDGSNERTSPTKLKEVLTDVTDVSDAGISIPDTDREAGNSLVMVSEGSKLISSLGHGKTSKSSVPTNAGPGIVNKDNGLHDVSQVTFQSFVVGGVDLTNTETGDVNKTETVNISKYNHHYLSNRESKLEDNTDIVDSMNKLKESHLDNKQQMIPSNSEPLHTNKDVKDQTHDQTHLLWQNNVRGRFGGFEPEPFGSVDNQINSQLVGTDGGARDSKDTLSTNNDVVEKESRLDLIKESTPSDLSQSDTMKETSESLETNSEPLTSVTFSRRTLSSESSELSEYGDEEEGGNDVVTEVSLLDTLESPEVPFEDLDTSQNNDYLKQDGSENSIDSNHYNMDDNYESTQDIPEDPPIYYQSDDVDQNLDNTISPTSVPGHQAFDHARPPIDQQYNSLNSESYTSWEKTQTTPSYTSNHVNKFRGHFENQNTNYVLPPDSTAGALSKQFDLKHDFEQPGKKSELGEVTPEYPKCPRKIGLSPVAHPVTAIVAFPGSFADWLRHAIEQISGEPSDSVYNVMTRLKNGDSSALFEMPHRSVIQTHSVYNSEFDKAIVVVTNPIGVEKQHLGFLPFSVEWRLYLLWENTIISWLSSNVPLLVLTSEDILADPQLYLSKITSFLDIDGSKVDMTCALLKQPPPLVDDVSKMASVYSNDRRRLARSIDAVIDTAYNRAPGILLRLFQYKTVLYM